MQQILIEHLLKARCWSSSWEYSDIPKKEQIFIKALALVGTGDLYPLWQIEFCKIIFILQNINLKMRLIFIVKQLKM